MKKNKLLLQKITVANLSESEMLQIKGGEGTEATACATCDDNCDPSLTCPTGCESCGYCTADTC